MGNTVTEDVKLPDKIAAALAGRTGSEDQFSRLQSDSGCKIQMSRDSGNICIFGIKDKIILYVTHAY